MSDVQVVFRMSLEQRCKLGELVGAVGPSISGWLRDKIDQEHSTLAARHKAEDDVAAGQLNEDELKMASNLGLRASQYLRGKQKG